MLFLIIQRQRQNHWFQHEETCASGITVSFKLYNKLQY